MGYISAAFEPAFSCHGKFCGVIRKATSGGELHGTDHDIDRIDRQGPRADRISLSGIQARIRLPKNPRPWPRLESSAALHGISHL
jgi:hypothetical protein